MGLLITIFAVIIAVFGMYKLSQVFLIWNDLALASQHNDIDKKGLVEWSERFKSKMSRINLLAFFGLIVAVSGVTTGDIFLSTAFRDIIFLGGAALIASLCVLAYERLARQYSEVVGMSSDEAADVMRAF